MYLILPNNHVSLTSVENLANNVSNFITKSCELHKWREPVKIQAKIYLTLSHNHVRHWQIMYLISSQNHVNFTNGES